ncbi:hypothetical protein OAS19_01690 [Altererythrobacter sp.]|nr:hypothetical protein [Altererythrobacter sp.]
MPSQSVDEERSAEAIQVDPEIILQTYGVLPPPEGIPAPAPHAASGYGTLAVSDRGCVGILENEDNFRVLVFERENISADASGVTVSGSTFRWGSQIRVGGSAEGWAGLEYDLDNACKTDRTWFVAPGGVELVDEVGAASE